MVLHTPEVWLPVASMHMATMPIPKASRWKLLPATGKLLRKAISAGSSSPSAKRAAVSTVRDKLTGCQFLIDTGSVTSILNRTFSYLPLSNHDSFPLFSVNGHDLKIFGHTTLTIDIGFDKKFTFTFVVADIDLNILGNDFLSFFDLSIRPASGELRDQTNNQMIKLKNSNIPIGSIVALTQEIHDTEVYNILKEYEHVFGPFSGTLVTDVKIKQEIRTTTNVPVFCRNARPLSKQHEQIARNEFDRMLQEGIIRRSNSAWASPLVLVPKKVEGDWRPCGDYRKLNTITQKDQYPLPNADHILAQCTSNKYFSTMDAQRAFYQIPLTEESIPKTAVRTPFGLFEFVRMPYGLRNSAQAFQRYIDEVIHGLDNVSCYIDDIIVATKTKEEHIETLKKLFERLSHYGIRLNSKKCLWMQTSVQFLGHMVAEDSLKPIDEKTEVIHRFPIPETVRELRSFLGTIEYYRRFLPHMSELTARLNRHLKPESKKKRNSHRIELTAEDITAIESVKEAFAKEMRLHSPDFEAPFQVYTDASDIAIGATLEQIRNNQRVPIAFFSRSLDKTERQYDTFGKELLGVYAAVNKFSLYLQPGNFTVFTDHQALIGALHNCTDNYPRRVRTQLQKLSEYAFEIVHVKGGDNSVADYLSRISAIASTTPFVSLAEIKAEQDKDNSIQQLVTKTPHHFHAVTIDGMRLWCVRPENDDDNCRIIPIIPTQLRRKIFEQIHNMNHFGVKRTEDLLKKRYFWPKMRRDVKIWCEYCERCQISKVYRHTKVAQSPVAMPTVRFSEIHMDFVDLPPCQGYIGLLTITDRFTRWIEALPVRSNTTKTVIEHFLFNWAARYGFPERIITDRGSQFMSNEFRAALRFLGIKHNPTTAYNPRSNGIDERQHRIIKDSLRALDGDNWLNNLPMLLLSMRNAVKEPINTSSAFLTFGQELRFPGEYVQGDSESTRNVSHSEIAQRLTEIFTNMKPVKSKRARKPVYVPQKLEDAKFVYKQVPAKQNCLSPLYEGPYEVVAKQDKYWILKKGDTTDTVSKDRLIPAMLSTIDREEPTSSSSSPLPTASSSTSLEPITSTATDASETQIPPASRLREQPKKTVRFINENY